MEDIWIRYSLASQLVGKGTPKIPVPAGNRYDFVGTTRRKVSRQPTRELHKDLIYGFRTVYFVLFNTRKFDTKVG